MYFDTPPVGLSFVGWFMFCVIVVGVLFSAMSWGVVFAMSGGGCVCFLLLQGFCGGFYPWDGVRVCGASSLCVSGR